MSDLSGLKDTHRIFLEAYADTGNISEACRQAGFSSRTSGYKVMDRHGHLLEQLVKERISEAGMAGVAQLKGLINNTKNDMVKFNAIKFLMGLAGYTATEKRELTISGLTDEQVENELKKLLGYEEEEAEHRQAKSV